MTHEYISDLTIRELALDPTKSFIVQAPAGSGKTSLLVARYLSLLSQVNNPEEIIAITFTKKAAYEMRSRIIAALKNCNENFNSNSQHELTIQKLAQSALAHNQEKKWNILQNPNCLRIQTIDAFCHYLVNQTPIFTKINANFQIIQNQEAEAYYSKAARAALKSITEPEYAQHLERLLLHLDVDLNRTENLFITMLKSREQWLPHIVGLKNTKELRKKMELALEEISQENLERCITIFPKELLQKLSTILKTLQVCHEEPPSILQEIVCEKTFFKSNLTTWQKIAEILLTKNFSWREKITKEQGFPSPSTQNDPAKKELYKTIKLDMESLLTRLNQYENLRASLKELRLSPPLNYHDEQWAIIESLLVLLPLLVAHLKVIFNEHWVTDHTEVAMAALRTLGDEGLPSDIALNLDYRLQHLLIDEFQDTSLSHYRLLEKLTTSWQSDDGRTLFIVGDPMQSIYRFREAEVGLFLRVIQNGINDLRLLPLTLTTNFRAAQKLIDWNNSNFAKILPTLPDISLGAIPFSPSTAIINNPHSLTQITLLKNSTDENEASKVVDIIKKISQQNPNDTIAILVKARRHLHKIIPALRIANLNYQAFELETLHENMVIRDLFSLTRALFDLTDRISWLAILRAPWCGLKLGDLHKIAHGKSKLIWDNINNQKTLNLSAEGVTRLTRFTSALLPIIEQRKRMSWRELIEKAWLLLGGPATVANQAELEHAAIYLELLKDPLDITTLQRQLGTLYIPQTVNAKIQIMTIHKAKGLEFDHVIIPGVNRSTRSNERKLMMWFERPKLHQGSSLLLAPIATNGSNNNPIYQYLQTVEQKKTFYENGRLLYVAMTRAKKTTHITGDFNDGIQTGSLLEQLIPCFDEKWLQEESPRQELVNIQEQNPVKIFRLSDDWQLPITIDLPQDCHKPYFELVDNQATIIGTVIHYCLLKISEGNITSINQRKLLQAEGFLDIEHGLELIDQAIKTTLNDKRGQWILATHKDAISELAITSQINGRFDNYIIDRTFIDEDNVRWIIDYKTSQPAKEEVIYFLQQEATRYSAQLLQYAAVMQNIDPHRPIRLGLYFPLFAGWIEIPFENSK